MRILACLLLVGVSAHSWLFQPAPRENDAIESDLNHCTPDKFGSNGVASYTRGQVIDVKWWGNNHQGGFIQLAIVSKANAGQSGVFQQTSNIYFVTCYRPSDFPTGSDETPQNGRAKCTKKFTIPTNLADGDYTMQWLQYGSGNSKGDVHLSLVDYVSCHDFTVSGGPTGAKQQCPTFVGGDEWGSDANSCHYWSQTIWGVSNPPPSFPNLPNPYTNGKDFPQDMAKVVKDCLANAPTAKAQDVNAQVNAPSVTQDGNSPAATTTTTTDQAAGNTNQGFATTVIIAPTPIVVNAEDQGQVVKKKMKKHPQ